MYTASEVYGGTPSRQPTPTDVPDHAGTPEPFARTTPRPSAAGVLGNPVLLLVGLLALAALLVNVTVAGSFEVSA